MLKHVGFYRDTVVPLVSVLLFLAIVLKRTITNSDGFLYLLDFHIAYYRAGQLVQTNPNHLYYADCVQGFVNLPIVAALFAPFAWLNETVASGLFLFLGILAALTAGIILVQQAPEHSWERALLCGLLAINVPLHNTLFMGNTSHFTLLLLIGVFFSFKSQRDIWSGVFLAIAGIIKLPLLFLLLFFLLEGRWKVVLSAGATLVTTAGASLMIFGLPLHQLWLNQCVFEFSNKSIGAFNVQSLDSFLIRIIANTPIDSWLPIEVTPEFKLLRFLVVALLVGSAIRLMWYTRKQMTSELENLEFSIFLCLALLISPISWTHYYSFLFLPIALYLGNQLAVPKQTIWLCLILLATVLISLPPFKTLSSEQTWFTDLARWLLVPHFFWGNLLLYATFLMAQRLTPRQRTAGAENKPKTALIENA